MLIEVTQEDIDNGEKLSETNCAVALAINSCMGIEWAFVGAKTVDLGFDKIELPIEVQHFIENFDNDFPVKPFSFEL